MPGASSSGVRPRAEAGRRLAVDVKGSAKHWTLQKNIAPSIQHGGYWELPYLVPLDGRHVLMVGAGNPYWVGRYDPKTMEFTPGTPHCARG